MPWTDWLACFFGGAFLTNSAPHLTTALMGRLFPTPFAKPHGRGPSSTLTNLVWGWVNLALGYVLLVQVADLDLHDLPAVLCAAAGALLMGVYLALHFGRVPAFETRTES